MDTAAKNEASRDENAESIFAARVRRTELQKLRTHSSLAPLPLRGPRKIIAESLKHPVANVLASRASGVSHLA
jgi:hypothetical protein